ncbi:MAG: UbiA prenyltransferase family protein [Dysgonamonadaceae bacterium]|jgi:4-hydroxybenzoate polyprenyltransferase|nr:UbiA prenyltransferase family protein [Dysgonamonadaceae bacterium]
MSPYIQLLRPHQWVKNTFVFLPLFFSGQFYNRHLLYVSIVAFIAYSFVSSAIYCFNDIYDADMDRLHPTKRKRPIASGAISKKAGFILMALCLVIGFSLLYFLKMPVSLMLLLGFYFVMNIAYCVKLKQISIIDVLILSFGFVLRILAGGLATDVWISEWIIVMTFLLALFLAFAKRRDDFMIYEHTGIVARKNIVTYNAEFLNAALIMTSTITIVAYILYAVSPEVTSRFGSHYVYITALFVLAGILRYLQLTFVLEKSGNPTQILLKDPFIQISILGWIGTFAFIMYL